VRSSSFSVRWDARETDVRGGGAARIMRVLTPLFIFEEVAPQTYRHTARSASMRDRGVAALMVFGCVPCFAPPTAEWMAAG